MFMFLYSGILAAWREVKTIVLLISGFSLLTLVARKWGLTLLSTGLLGWIFYFFRDPERAPPSLAFEWILAPADGKITAIEVVEEPLFFKGQAQRVSMFLSLFDVHVQRIPYQGQVEFVHYQAGDFGPAFLKDTRSNEYNMLGLSTPQGPIAVKQIAGILAQRIVCWTDMGEKLATGQRFGLIKFGSRVDVLLSPDVEILTYIGQKVYGGQTIIARWKN